MKRLAKLAAIIAAFVTINSWLIVWIFHPESEISNYSRELIAEFVTVLAINGWGFWVNSINLLVAEKDFKILMIGWGMDKAIGFVFEYVLYPVVIRVWGLIHGGFIMILASIAESLILVWLYDKTKKDWLGFERLKAFQEAEDSRVIQWFLKKNRLIAVIGLSLLSEPVKVTLYMRRGAAQYGGFGKEDWKVFFISVLVGNISWTLIVFGVWKVFDWIPK